MKDMPIQKALKALGVKVPENAVFHAKPLDPGIMQFSFSFLEPGQIVPFAPNTTLDIDEKVLAMLEDGKIPASHFAGQTLKVMFDQLFEPVFATTSATMIDTDYAKVEEKIAADLTVNVPGSAAAHVAQEKSHDMTAKGLAAKKALKEEVWGDPPEVMDESTKFKTPPGISGTKTGTFTSKGVKEKLLQKSDEVHMTYPTEQYPLKYLSSGDTVKLGSAKQMYQPVKGTSAGSRYFAIALSSRLNLALRWKGTGMAIRIEGPGLKDADFQAHMKSVGFGNTDNEYGSLHLKVGAPVIAMKVIGSLLMAIQGAGGEEFKWDTALPDLHVIKDKGN